MNLWNKKSLFSKKGSNADESADLALGRLPVNSVQQAEIVVDKIIDYESTKTEGIWRNRITLVADDGYTTTGDDGSLHTRQSEELSRDFVPSYFDQQKIYLADYLRPTNSGRISGRSINTMTFSLCGFLPRNCVT